jgi:hypothetical protein
MESKTTKIVALIAFGVSMFVLGRVTDCGSNCFTDSKCDKQFDPFCGESGIVDLDIEALVGEHFEGDTVIFINDDNVSKEIRIERRVELDTDKGHDHDHDH